MTTDTCPHCGAEPHKIDGYYACGTRDLSAGGYADVRSGACFENIITRLRAENADLRERLAGAAAQLKKIVETDGEDAGVIYLSNDSPTHTEVRGEYEIQVYDHAYFSPLGDALIELYQILEPTEESKGE